MTTPHALAITAAIFLLSPTALLAGCLAHDMWGYGADGWQSQMIWPITIFSFNATCLACCALTRNSAVAVFFVLATCGGFALLLLVTAAWRAS